MADLQNNLPPGWDCKFDERSGKYYYVNHFSKSTTWDDPRIRANRLQGTPKHFSNVQVEHIPLQHGSPEFRRNYVYPSQPSPIPAFQIPPHMSPKSVPFQDLRNVARMSPLTLRNAKVQDSSFTVPVPNADVEAEAVAKIGAMFPTVSETHIKLLMKKYHSREALVISALQVEKHPITTPGPFATPPPQRNIAVAAAAQHQPPPPLGLRGSRGGSPATRSAHSGSPRPQSSPKLKLRYMKSIFPQADETVILDILQNNDNNIQKTSDALKDMGFNKKDTLKLIQQKIEEKKEEQKKKEEEVCEATVSTSVQPKMKTSEEKNEIKQMLQDEYKDVAEHLITMALESVNFDENRANQILKIMIQEDTEAAKQKEEPKLSVSETDSSNPAPSTSKSALPVSQSRQSIKSLLKSDRIDKEFNTFSRVIEENGCNTYKSQYISNTNGHNPNFAKGPNEKLLLKDYVEWSGANPSLRAGAQSLAKGPNRDLLSKRTYKPCGPNASLRKGSLFSLANGSMFGQFKAVSVGDGGHE